MVTSTLKGWPIILEILTRSVSDKNLGGFCSQQPLPVAGIPVSTGNPDEDRRCRSVVRVAPQLCDQLGSEPPSHQRVSSYHKLLELAKVVVRWDQFADTDS